MTTEDLDQQSPGRRPSAAVPPLGPWTPRAASLGGAGERLSGSFWGRPGEALTVGGWESGSGVAPRGAGQPARHPAGPAGFRFQLQRDPRGFTPRSTASLRVDGASPRRPLSDSFNCGQTHVT